MFGGDGGEDVVWLCIVGLVVGFYGVYVFDCVVVDWLYVCGEKLVVSFVEEDVFIILWK